MAATTFEEAKQCPKCGLPGQDTGSHPTKKSRVRVHTIFCRNADCRWHNTSWLVQVNEDGSIPEAHTAVGPKQFPLASPETESRIQESIAAQLKAETRPGSEVNNPHGSQS